MNTVINGIKIFKSRHYKDKRGFFREVYKKNYLKRKQLIFHCTSTSKKNVIRGLHFQWDKPMGKLLRVTTGRAHVVEVDIRKDFINNPDGVLTLGYFVAHIEKQKELISKRAQSGMEGEVLSITNPETDKQFECFLTAVSSFIGLSEARSIWKSIVTGSLETSTIIGGLALMAKRVATIATVTIMIYEAGDCLGWWN